MLLPAGLEVDIFLPFFAFWHHFKCYTFFWEFLVPKGMSASSYDVIGAIMMS